MSFIVLTGRDEPSITDFLPEGLFYFFEYLSTLCVVFALCWIFSIPIMAKEEYYVLSIIICLIGIIVIDNIYLWKGGLLAQLKKEARSLKGK